MTAVVSLGMLLVLIHALYGDIRLNAGERATAVVSSVTSASRLRPASATVSFSVEGQQVTTHVLTGFLADDPVQGQQVRVAFSPEDPTRARLLGADDLTEPGLLFLVSATALLIGLRRLRIHRQPSKRP